MFRWARILVVLAGLCALVSATALPAAGSPAQAHSAKKAKCKKRSFSAAAAKKKKKCKKPSSTPISSGSTTPGSQTTNPPGDTTPPVVSILSPTPPDITGPSGTVNFSVGDATSVLCQLDSTTVPCDSSGFYDFTGLSDGHNTFYVQGTDAAGNTAFQSVTWTVDAEPPHVTATLGSSGDPSTAEIDVGGFDLSAFDLFCRLDSGSPVTCNSGSVDYTETGDHDVTVYGVDVWGNSGESFLIGQFKATVHFSL